MIEKTLRVSASMIGNVSANQDDDSYDLDDNVSLATLASDELYIFIKTLCLAIQIFYTTWLDETTTTKMEINHLYEDLMKMSQKLVF